MQIRQIPSPFAIVGILALFLLSACSSGPPKPDVDYSQAYDFSKVRTVAFYKDSGQVSGDDPLRLSDMQRDRIDDAIRVAVENKGVTFLADPAKADLLLSWHLATADKTDIRTYQSASVGYGGYGGYNRYSRYSCWSCMPTQTQVSVSNYTEGTFIVDMIDPELGKSVWRAVTQSKLKGKQKHEQAKLDQAAALIFASFPPP